MLVLLPDVVFLAEVHQVDDGFGGEEEQRVDDFDLVFGISGRPFPKTDEKMGKDGLCQSWSSSQDGLYVSLYLSRSTSWDNIELYSSCSSCKKGFGPRVATDMRYL